MVRFAINPGIDLKFFKKVVTCSDGNIHKVSTLKLNLNLNRYEEHLYLYLGIAGLGT